MADLQDLLVKTSRTFALSIPLLPEPTRRQVTIAYLLFRIADTFEDAWRWPRSRRIAALERLSQLLRRPVDEGTHQAALDWVAEQPTSQEGYLELLSETPAVLDEFAALSATAQKLIAHHTIRTADGMARFVARTSNDGSLALRDIPDLQGYCYVVAGIVGEMLTELFILNARTLEGIGDFLRQRASRFGEALQLVNILKDSAHDLQEGRCYLPPSVGRSEIFSLARQDLATAVQYVQALQEAGAPRGYVAFTALPVSLAWATLDRVEDRGAGAKLSRPEVSDILSKLHQALDNDQPVVG